MLRRNPQLTDDLILANSMRSREGGPAVVDDTPILKHHAARQMADQRVTEDRGRGLNLANQRLDQSNRHFNEMMAMQRDTLRKNRKLSDISNIISGVGLGLSGINSYQNRQRSLERQNRLQGIIDKNRKMGGDYNNFVADFLKGFME